MGLAKKLAIGAIGTAVALGADSSLVQPVYDTLHQLTGADAYTLENVVRAAGAATALGAGGSALYQGIRDTLGAFADEASKFPKAAAALGLASIITLAADSNAAYEIYDALMLYPLNVSSVSTAVKTVGGIGVFASGLATLYHGVLDIVGSIGKKFGK